MKLWQWILIGSSVYTLAIVLWCRFRGWQKAEESQGAKLAPPSQAEALLD